MLVTEDIIGRVAPLLGIAPEELRRRNFYAEGQATPYGQPVRHPERMVAAWDQVSQNADLARRQAEVAAYNAAHPHTKRGLAITPVKFGISFNFTAFNQGGALVHVYKDGSVLINHGGTEMGQGLHTKMLQVAATALGLPIGQGPPGADPHRQGAQHLRHRGERWRRPQRRRRQGRLRADHDPPAAGARRAPRSLLGGAGRQAYHQRVQLWAAGFYRTEGLSWDVATMTGSPFKYFAYGAAVAEVEVDGFTGANTTRRVDIVHDVGDCSPRWSTSGRSRAGSCRAPAG